MATIGAMVVVKSLDLAAGLGLDDSDDELDEEQEEQNVTSPNPV